MARFAVLASGQGSNFQALVEASRLSGRHECGLLVHDRARAFVAERAQGLGVTRQYVDFKGRSREEAEAEIHHALLTARTDLVVLAGFMRLLSPGFVALWKGRIINIHPSLLPAYPGADAIRRAYLAGEDRFGITVHFVDEGMDTGPIIAQDSFQRQEGESEEGLTARIHDLEHHLFPKVVLELLDALDAGRLNP